MLISQEMWSVSPGIELIRNGNQVTFNLSGSASGYYNEELGYYEWYGTMELTFGEQYDYFEQYYDRPMDLSLTETLIAGVVTTGSYYIYGDPSASADFNVILFDTAATYAGTAGIDYVFGSDQADSLSGAAGDDGFEGGLGDDWLNGGQGGDLLDGGGGTDTASYAGAATGVVARLYDASLNYGEARGDRYISIEVLEGSSFNDHLYGDGAANTLFGRDGNDRLFGGNDDDILDGGIGNDILDGGAGADTLIGGLGVDMADGGDGDDTYHVDNMADRVFEVAGAGSDRVLASTSYVLEGGQEIENLSISPAAGVTAIDLTGNEFAQVLTGNAGANTLDGGGGADTMRGLAGGDLYLVDNAGDQVFEAAGQGTDRVSSSVSYTLAAGQSVEGLYFTNTAATTALNLTGNELNQSLTGNAGGNILVGGGGADTMRGLAGDDFYSVDNVGDQVIEVAGGGTDRVSAAISYTLAAGQSIEGMYLTNAAATTALNLTGNELAQSLTGNAGNNILVGGGGADTMRGLAGNDTYSVDNAGDVVFEAAGQGTDRVSSAVSYTLTAGQSIESLYLTNAAATTALNLVGNDLAQSLTGNAGNNLLDGKGGADTLRGLAGNDSFQFSTALGSGNVDHIADFSAADDTIRLRQSVFTELGLGTLTSTAYKDIASGTVDADDRILYDSGTGQIFYDSNGSVAGGRFEFAVLDNKPASLTNADFLVVA